MMMRPRQGNKARAKLPSLAAESLPSASAGICWLGKKEGIVKASPLPHFSSSRQPPTSCRAGDGHSELGEAWPKLILSADSQGLWKRSFSVQWGQRSGVLQVFSLSVGALDIYPGVGCTCMLVFMLVSLHACSG